MDELIQNLRSSRFFSLQDCIWALLLLGVGFMWFLTQREKALAQQQLERRTARHESLQKAIRSEGYDVHYSAQRNVLIKRARN